MTTTDPAEILTRAEVAELTRISLATLARWAGEGSGPKFRKAGGRVLYRRSDVLAWLDSLEAGGSADQPIAASA
ncbi:helix-turn-helix transcriptional regulator [Microbacterium sp.]|uniref:helix-turn-helix transcriptional regulator n=1 Tax=Microbacterium sp. TaxID=51671 RepID=UPI0039E2460C